MICLCGRVCVCVCERVCAGEGHTHRWALFPILSSNLNIRKLVFFFPPYIHPGASSQHQALEASACEDM